MSEAHALAIWQAGVDAVAPGRLVKEFFQSSHVLQEIQSAKRVLVVGAGKATAAMAVAIEELLACDRIAGLVNVPEGIRETTRRIRLNHARPQGSNYPTAQGVAGAREMLELFRHTTSEEVAICLISGGGSALLPCPADGISLDDKLQLTKQLHASGATILEMNCVRKHISAIKGGQLANAFRGRRLYSLIISDVVGDPLDVIASGPTVTDPTTNTQAIAILEKHKITPPFAISEYLRKGLETPKQLPSNIENHVIGSNAIALSACLHYARSLGYDILNLGPNLEGETSDVAKSMAELVRKTKGKVAILSGGETTVTLGNDHGKGGRNQEFVLAMMHELGPDAFQDVTVLSGGTDGEDGPTDAAGAIATRATFERCDLRMIHDHLLRHDAYPFFDRIGGLIKSGLTGTNVMDLRVVLVNS